VPELLDEIDRLRHRIIPALSIAKHMEVNGQGEISGLRLIIESLDEALEGK
jgi:hypothetical protein